MTISNLTIRPYKPSDLDTLHRIRTAAFEPVFRSFREILGPEIAGTAMASAESEQAELLNDLCGVDTPQQVFVGELDKAIVGFVSISFDEKQKVGELGLNAVDPLHAGRGYGTELYEYALNRMKDAGMKVATVGTGGDPSHAPARRAYEKAGFGPALPSLWMYRTL